MRFARPAAAVLAGLVLSAPAPATTRALPPAPAELHAFLLRADEISSHTFARTPSFAWAPVLGAERYEFELAASPTFNDGSIVWSDATLRTPAASIPYSLPWMTGTPYALYAHVRAWTRDGSSQWSAPFGFNMRWQSLPQPIPTYPGLVSWSVVPGATSYDVWFTDASKVIETRTNVADERDYFDFHQQNAWTGIVHWRVRAIRNLYGSASGLPNGLPAVTYGPWSKIYTSANAPLATGPIKLTAAVSDVTSSAAQPEAHNLTPAFAFTGNQGLDGNAYELYRAYVFTDRDCVNVVFRSAIIGSPAYAPRTTGPLKLPATSFDLANARTTFLADGDEPSSYMADLAQLLPTEMDKAQAGADTSGQSAAAPSSSSSTAAPAAPPADPGTAPSGTSSLPSTPKVKGAPVDLWDSGWPNGRYYWTVVPVRIVQTPAVTTSLASSVTVGATTIPVVSSNGFPTGSTITVGTGATQETVTILDSTSNLLTLSRGLTFAHATAEPVVNPSPGLEYHDAELPQDACAAGRVATFGKVSEPVLAGTTSPYASGLSPSGRLEAAVSGKPTFYGTPLVAWQPAIGADEYQVQWSPTKYPWSPAGQRVTFATSAALDQVVDGKRVGLTPGTWYYRVRGLDFSLPGTARAMSWSDPVAFVVARPTFKVISTAAPKAAALSKNVRYSSAEDGFSLSVPRAWQRVPTSATSTVRFAALDPNAVQGFKTNVNVILGAPRGSLSDADWQKAAVADASRFPGLVGTVSSRLVTLPAGRAVWLGYQAKVGGRLLSFVQYAIDDRTRSLVLTFTTPAAASAKYAATFAAIAKSFALSA